jgi:hypothetical protein
MKGSPISILLLLGWILPTLMTYVNYERGRAISHTYFISQKNNIAESEIQTFHIPNLSKLKWEVANKEFMLNDHLYDVISIEKIHDNYIIRCIKDAKEENVVWTYLKALDLSNKKDTDRNSTLKTIDVKYLPTRNPVLTYTPLTVKNPIFTFKPKLSGTYIELFSPPPEIYSAYPYA